MQVLITLRAATAEGSTIRENLKRFGFRGPVGSGNGYPGFETSEKSGALQEWLWQEISSTAVVSAAFVAKTPHPDRLWIAAEWQERIVVEHAVIDEAGLDEHLWSRNREFQRDDLAVFRPLPSATEKDGNLEILPQPKEFRAILWNSRPHTAVVSLHAILENRNAWFGDLAGEQIGGSVALISAALDHVDPHEQLIRLGNPAACGFHKTDGQGTLPYWISNNVIAAHVWGGQIGEHPKGFESSETVIPDGVPPTREWRERGWGFALTLKLNGLEDPEVIFGSGVVFEQPNLNGQQNLAVAHGGQVSVGVGQTLQVMLPAWCLNRHFGPPNGLMRPTPLAYDHGGAGGQRDVWDEIASRRVANV